MRDGNAVQVPVRIRRRNAESVLVEGELRPGEQVVVQGVQLLRPGSAVVIKPQLAQSEIAIQRG